MQLHNLVLISIQRNHLNFINPLNNEAHSPIKNNSNSLKQKDQISWKKSNSAFKKFKGKTNREKGSIQNSQTKREYFNQNNNILSQYKKFYLINNHLKMNLLTVHNQQTFKVELEYQYYDPNIAPFFQYNQLSLSNSKLKRPTLLQLNRQLSNSQMNLSCNIQQKQFQKKQTLKQKQKQKQEINLNINFQLIQQDIIVNKNINFNRYNKQILCQSEYLIEKKENLTGLDPFIIIKSNSQKKIEVPIDIIIKKQQSKKEDYKRTKTIKKHTKNTYFYNYSPSYIPYLNNKQTALKNIQHLQLQNEDMINQDDFQINLPFIQFNPSMHLPSKITYNIEEDNQCSNVQEQLYENQINYEKTVKSSLQSNQTYSNQIYQNFKLNNQKQSQINILIKLEANK